MALYLRNYNTINLTNISFIFKVITNYHHLIVRFYIHKSNGKKFEMKTDILDDFTNKLIQQKSEKWDSININRKRLFGLLKTNNHNHNTTSNITNLNDTEILKYCQSIDKNLKTIDSIVNQFVKNKTRVPYNILMRLISLLGHCGDKENINKLIQLGEQTNVLRDNDILYCQQHLAEAIWIKGNVQEAINIFQNLYETNISFRRNICLLLRFLIGRTVELRTEAVLVQIRIFIEELAAKYNEYGPLSCLWETCVLSEWFSDQTTALEMLEKDATLREYLSSNYLPVIMLALKIDNIDIVHRMFEIFLKYKMTKQYIPVLQLLFDYHYNQRDFRRCAEIIRWSTNLNITLSTEQNEKFLNLLLRQYGLDLRIETKSKKPPPQPPHFKFKF